MNNLHLYLAFTTLVLLLIQPPLHAQDQSELDYIILNNDDTLFGQVSYIDESGSNREFYKKVRLQTVDGKRIKYKREDIAAFRTDGQYYEGFSLSMNTQKGTFFNARYDLDSKNGEYHFFKVVSKGTISHYKLEWFEQGEALLMDMSLLKKEGETYFIRADQGLLGLKKQALLSYFHDCPRLQTEIKEQQLNEVWEVVDFYNHSCAE